MMMIECVSESSHFFFGQKIMGDFNFIYMQHGFIPGWNKMLYVVYIN